MKTTNINPMDICVVNTGMSKARIARMLGISRSAVYQWESKGIPQNRIKELSEITGVPERLLTEKPRCK